MPLLLNLVHSRRLKAEDLEHLRGLIDSLDNGGVDPGGES